MGIGGNIIKNPLTIIAIFAGIVEIGSNTVLPFLTDENQATYIWFLMIFPIILVLCFFYILYNKHEVLYAPSDFKNDETFQNVLNGRDSTSKEINEKLKEEIKLEIKEEITKEDNKKSSHAKVGINKLKQNDDLVNSFRDNFLMARNRYKIKNIENKLLKSLKLNSDESLKKEITIEDNKGNKLVCDGIIYNERNKDIHIIEVKLLTNGRNLYTLLRRYVEKNSIILKNIKELQNINIKLTFLILTPDRNILNYPIISTIKEELEIDVTTVPYYVTSIPEDTIIEYENIDGIKNKMEIK